MPQPLVLAIEPDLRQAAIVKRIVRDNGLADVVVVDSRDAAIEALRTAMPDVLLLSALLSPRDEDELVAHLRTLDNAGHLQTHTIPQLASPSGAGEERASRGLLSAFRRKKDVGPVGGCDPDLYADEIRTYLQHAADKKRELHNLTFVTGASRPNPAKAEPVQTTAPEVDEATAPGSAWSSPFEWKPASASTRSARPREEAPARHAPPPPMPAPEIPAPGVDALFSTAPAVEPPSIIKPAAEVPVLTNPIVETPLVVQPPAEPVIAPVHAATIAAEPKIERIEPPVDKQPASVTRRSPVPGDVVVELDVPVVAKKSAKSPESPRPKAVADRPAKLTGPAQLRELIARRPAAVDGGGRDPLGPLARWARSEPPRVAKSATVTAEDVRSLISSLAVPAAVASVTYARGVRIRRVRVPLPSDQDTATHASA